MKKTAFLFAVLIFVTTTSLFAQNTVKPTQSGQIGISFSSFGSNDVFTFQQLEGAASYNADKFYTIGINYLYPLNKTFDIETDFEYSKHHITIEPNLPPDMGNTSYGAEFSVINIPVTVRVNFLRYFFANGGLMVGIDPNVSSPVDSQSGIGALMGFGLKYDSKSGIAVFVNPYFKAHALISFSSIEYPQHLMESGFRFGVMYKLK